MLFGEVLVDMFPDRTVLGGAPFNVAWHLRAFGQNPLLITRLGHDALCNEILDRMSLGRMDTSGVQFDKNHPTGRVRVHIEENGHHFDILPLQAYDFIHPAIARMAILSVNPALVYFGTLAQRHDVSRRALKTLLNSTKATRFLDINLRAPWYERETLVQSLKRSNIVKLNNEELAVLAEMLALPGNEPQEHVRELMQRFEIERTVVTCGEAGAWQMGSDGRKSETDNNRKTSTLVDTVGAGDGFSAVCMLGALLGWHTAMTLDRANGFAAAICGLRGAIPHGMDFYKPFIEEWSI